MRGNPRNRLLLAIFAGGALGALARAGLAQALPDAGRSWPWATFLVNVAGAALLGWAAARLADGTRGRAFVGPGVCGGLTTFSTLQLELVRLLGSGRTVLAAGYAGATLLAGYGAVQLGARAAQRTAAA